jgi:polyisoprenoid-binding protein YceI
MSDTPKPRRRWKRWLVGGLVLAIVVFVGGPFVYIHFIEGSAPAPFSLSNAPTSTTAATGATTTVASGAGPSTTADGAADTSSVDGTWTVTTGSEVGYRVGEVLFGQSTTAVGRTTAVTGSMTIAGTTVSAGSFTADMTKVHSDKSQRDDQFQGRIMDTSRYPTATFKLTSPINLSTIPADGTEITQQATGELTLHGTTRTVTFPLQAKRSASSIEVVGSIPVTFADYNIANPSFGGVVTTQDHGTLEFLLDFTRS